MIDLQTLKFQLDLLAIAGQHTALKRIASSGGGEWAGPCPFCGGKDRFHVQPHHPRGGRWLCRQCSEGRWQDAIAFGQRLWPGVSFREVCERLSGGRLPETAINHPPAPEIPAYRPPDDDWQAASRQAVAICQQNLWASQGQEALEYLHGRGLKDETIYYWRLGYSSGQRFGSRLPQEQPLLAGEPPAAAPAAVKPQLPDATVGQSQPDNQRQPTVSLLPLWIPRGVLIPCIALNQVWYFKVSLLPGSPVKCEKCRAEAQARRPCPHCGSVNKYRGVKGNRTAAIYGADDLRGAWGALFVEGEFDALIAWQELRDVISVCTLGSATNRPDLATWGPYLLPLELILAVYDADPAGRRGVSILTAMSERVREWQLPPGVKDINEFYLQGGQLWPWLKEGLGPQAAALGGLPR